MRGKTAGAKEGKLPDKAGSGRQAAVEVSKRPAAAGCRAYMRRRLVKEFPEIVQGFVEAAKTGSCAHVKLATELIRPAKAGSKRTKKGPAVRFLEMLDREQEEAARARGATGRSDGECESFGARS